MSAQYVPPPGRWVPCTCGAPLYEMKLAGQVYAAYSEGDILFYNFRQPTEHDLGHVIPVMRRMGVSIVSDGQCKSQEAKGER